MAKIGRPAIPGENITIRLTDDELAIISAGSELNGRLTDKTPSRAAWFRNLVYYAFDSGRMSDLIGPEDLASRWDSDWTYQKTPNQVTVRIEEHQRVQLRQFECYVQSLDWTRFIGRNEVSRMLIEMSGPLYNRSLEVSLRKVAS